MAFIPEEKISITKGDSEPLRFTRLSLILANVLLVIGWVALVGAVIIAFGDLSEFSVLGFAAALSSLASGALLGTTSEISKTLANQRLSGPNEVKL